MYIRQHKQTQINKDIICENTTKIYHDYRVGDKVMTIDSSTFKYKNPFEGPYEIVQMCTNVTITIKMGAVTDR